MNIMRLTRQDYFVCTYEYKLFFNSFDALFLFKKKIAQKNACVYRQAPWWPGDVGGQKKEASAVCTMCHMCLCAYLRRRQVPCLPYASLRACVSYVLKQALNRRRRWSEEGGQCRVHSFFFFGGSALFLCVAGPLFFFVCGRSAVLRLPV